MSQNLKAPQVAERAGRINRDIRIPSKQNWLTFQPLQKYSEVFSKAKSAQRSFARGRLDRFSVTQDGFLRKLALAMVLSIHSSNSPPLPHHLHQSEDGCIQMYLKTQTSILIPCNVTSSHCKEMKPLGIQIDLAFHLKHLQLVSNLPIR